MDWDQANVSLDRDAFVQAQSAAGHGFHIPTIWIVIGVIVLAAVAFTVAKKAKDGDKKDGGTGGDK